MTHCNFDIGQSYLNHSHIRQNTKTIGNVKKFKEAKEFSFKNYRNSTCISTLDCAHVRPLVFGAVKLELTNLGLVPPLYKSKPMKYAELQ